MMKFIKSSIKHAKNEVIKSKEEFEAFIKENEEINLSFRRQMQEQLCDNAYILGRIGEEIDYSKPVYEKMTDFERMQISNKWMMGKMDTIIKQLERVSTN